LNTLGTKTRSIGANDAGAVPRRRAVHCHDILGWNVFGQNHQQLDARLSRRHRGVLGHCRGNEHDRDITPDLRNRLGCGRKYRYSDVSFAGTFRVDARDHIGPVGHHFLAPESALLAGNTEHDDTIFPAHDHCAAFTAAWMASSMKS
jgi:hypothetical protein